MENIIVALVDGVFTLVLVCISVYVSNKKSRKTLESKVDKLIAHDEDQYLSILRLTIMSEDMPISERIIAGKKYVDKGGNGDVKKYYQKMIEEHTK